MDLSLSGFDSEVETADSALQERWRYPIKQSL